MTPHDIRDALGKIAALAEECDGLAHENEDELFLAVLTQIASGDSDDAVLARMALKSKAINKDYWYE